MDIELARDRTELAQIEDVLARRAECAFNRYFPDTGPLRRALYPRSLQFFEAGRFHKERLFLAANRTSKTVSAAFELTAHTTGVYPLWWKGRKFPGQVKCWVAGDTLETTRDIIQLELFGPRDNIRRGTYAGMIPGHLILDRTLKSGGVADCIDIAWIRRGREKVHGAPVASTVQIKTYAAGRLAFQGTNQDIVWLDEEPPDASDGPSGGGMPSGNGDIYTECLLRTSTTDGIVMTTLTPLRGLTPFIDHFLETAVICDADGHLVPAKAALFGMPTDGLVH